MNFLITGGASGLGNAITRVIATAFPGANVYFTYNASAQNAKELMDISDKVKGMQCDFNNNNDVAAICKLVSDADINVLVNNALTGLQKNYFHKTPMSALAAGFTTDIVPVLQITQAFLLQARKKKFGKIITILTAGLLNTPPIGWSAYLANKAYLQAMHRSWATENIAFNITSNCVSPDFMLTPLHNETDERVIENMIAHHPLNELLTTQEVAKAVLYICNASQQLNGQNIILNAGQNL